MAGAADPRMSFPGRDHADSIFRATRMQAGQAVQLSRVILQSLETRSLDLVWLMPSALWKKFNGSVNLVFEPQMFHQVC